MRTFRLSLALLVALVALPPAAVAQDVPLPRERPVVGEAVAPALPPVPRPRPQVAQQAAPLPGTPDGTLPSQPPAEASAQPRVYQTACPAVLDGDVVAEPLPPIAEGQCGLRSPLALSAVVANGRTIPLSAPITTDCGMATALPDWVADVDRWFVATEKTRIAAVNVGTGYMCRNVNSAATGNLSFHAFGAAVDVTGFTLEDGRTVAVETAWASAGSDDGRAVRFAHDAACTRFTTVLGPDADAQHHDHLHLDLGCHGRACSARLCQ